MAVRIYAVARERLFKIWDYTERTWGEEQADNYVRGLIEAVEHALDTRHRWRRVGDNKLKDVFFIRYEHHFVFFRELSGNKLGVISILHENMDIPLRLKQDAERGKGG